MTWDLMELETRMDGHRCHVPIARPQLVATKTTRIHGRLLQHGAYRLMVEKRMVEVDIAAEEGVCRSSGDL